MGFLNNTTVTVDAILTKKGRELLAQGTNAFNITKFALADDEVDYRLYDTSHPNGTDFYGAVIEAMPEDKLDYKATPEVRSFAFDIKHMIGGNYGMMSNALGVEAPKFDAESIKTKADMSQAVTECYDWVIKSLGEFDTSKNSEMVTMRIGKSLYLLFQVFKKGMISGFGGALS